MDDLIKKHLQDILTLPLKKWKVSSAMLLKFMMTSIVTYALDEPLKGI